MNGPCVHIIGAGVAGLATAVNLAKVGRRVNLYEAAGHAGGRCRSFDDASMGCRIDNGNHLLLSGNVAALGYLKDIGAEDSLTGPETAEFPFFDLKTNERWSVTLDAFFLLRGLFSKAGRVPGSRPVDYLKPFRLAWSGEKATVSECLGPDNALFRRFWEPISVAVLNTAAEEAAASLLLPVIRETLGRGAAACRPLMARDGLSESFIDPALLFLQGEGVEIEMNQRLRALHMDGGRVTALDFGAKQVALGAADAVVLAVPPPAAANLVPGLETPNDSRAIVNGHFRLEHEVREFSFLGLVSGVSQWLFVRRGVASVTVSAANDLAEEDTESIATRMWNEVAFALALGQRPLPNHRIVKEKRATFAQTPEQLKRRPAAATDWQNLYLAGDWTDTGLPATIEGSIRSGRKASEIVLLSSS